MSVGPRKRLRWALEYALLCSLLAGVRLAPERLWRAAGRGLGRMVHGGLGYRRRVVDENLAHAFPERTEAERRRIAAATYHRYGEALCEFLALSGWDGDEVRRRLPDLDLTVLRELHAEGRGAILMTGHVGNWELLGAAVAAAGLPIRVVARTQSNPWSDRLQNRIRRRAGLEVLKADASVREVVRALRRGEFVAMLPDVDAGPDGVFVDFLGRRASTPRGVAYLAWKLDCPIVARFVHADGRGGYRTFAVPTLRPDPDLAQDEAVAHLTQAMAANLEEAVRLRPDHYLWLHRRWKTRPPSPGTTGGGGTDA